MQCRPTPMGCLPPIILIEVSLHILEVMAVVPRIRLLDIDIKTDRHILGLVTPGRETAIHGIV